MSCAQHKNAPVLKKYRKTFDASVLNRYYSGQFTLAWNKKSDCELIETKDFKVNPLVFNGKQYPIKLLNLGHGQFREKADYYTIQAIGKNAFKDNKDIGIVFVVPTMIKTIDEKAFANTSIKNICINNVTTFLPINQNAFAGCKINKIIARNVLYKDNQEWNKICQNIVIKPYSLNDYERFILERSFLIGANYTVTDKSGNTIDDYTRGTCWIADKVNRSDDNDYKYWVATNLHILSGITKHNNNKYGNFNQKKIKNTYLSTVDVTRFDITLNYENVKKNYEKYKIMLAKNENKLISYYLLQLWDKNYNWDNFVNQFDNPTWKNDAKNQPTIKKLVTLLNCSINDLNANKINNFNDEIKKMMYKALHNKGVIDSVIESQLNEYEKIKEKLNEISEKLILSHLVDLYNKDYSNWDAFAAEFDNKDWKESEKRKWIIEELAIVLDCDFTNLNKQKIKELVKMESRIKKMRYLNNKILDSDTIKIDIDCIENMKQNFTSDFCMIKISIDLDKFPIEIRKAVKRKLDALNRFLSLNNVFVVFIEKILKNNAKVYSLGYPHGVCNFQSGEIFYNVRNYLYEDRKYYKWIYGIRNDEHSGFESGSSGSMVIDENFNIIGIHHSSFGDYEYISGKQESYYGYGVTNISSCLLVDDEYNPIAKFLHD